MIGLAIYHKLNKILLLSIGLWPYQQSKFTRFQYIFLYAILSTGVVLQLTSLIISKCTLDLLIKTLSSVSFLIMLISQYNGVCLNIEAIKRSMLEFQCIHNKLKDKNEIAIIEKYSCAGKRYTIVLTAIGACTIFTFIIIQIWSNIANIHLSVNASELQYLFITEYYIDQKKYLYLILLYNVIIGIGMVAIIMGIATLHIINIEYICGMFRIASYRIEHAINIDILESITSKNENFMIEGIICAVDIHRQAMKLVKYLISTFEIMIFCMMVCVVVCFSLNLFQIFQLASFENNINKFYLPFLFASICFLYMLISNYLGQSIIDHNNHIFVTAYNARWYRTPLHVQRMILFVLQRGTKAFSINIGGIYNTSIEGFASLLKISVSYFTLMHSLEMK